MRLCTATAGQRAGAREPGPFSARPWGEGDTACWVPAGSWPGGAWHACAEHTRPVPRPCCGCCMSRAPWQRAGTPGDPMAPFPVPWASSCCTLPAPSHPCRYPAGPMLSPCSAPRCCRSAQAQHLRCRHKQVTGPCWHSCRVEGALGDSCRASAGTERISGAQLLLPWVLLDGFSLEQPVLPRKFLSVCTLESLPTLVPVIIES